MIDEILKVLPSYISLEIQKINNNQTLNEIRLRARQKVILKCVNQEIVLESIVTTKTILEILCLRVDNVPLFTADHACP